jgi:membrane associated rhomboid family serine protease
MSSRYSRNVTYQFGPGGMTPAIRMLLYANIGVFLLQFIAQSSTFGQALINFGGLRPSAVFEQFFVWQVVTYLFLHGSFTHILFNMLYLWMFGVQLERRWGTQAFTRYYFITGIGAGLTVLLVSLLPLEATRSTYHAVTIGASGAIYAVMLAWALVFPDQTIMFMMMVPLPSRVFVALMAAISFFSAFGSSGTGVAHFAHLGGLVVGYLYLKGPKGPRDLKLEIQYRLTKWRMDRMRKKFDVHRGGRVH